MPRRSPLSTTEAQRVELQALARSREHGETDWARAVLLTVAGWTSPQIAEVFGVHDDTVRLWRSDFMQGGVAALKASVAPGPAPVNSEAALRVALPLLAEPVAERPNSTIPRLRGAIEAREGVQTSRSKRSDDFLAHLEHLDRLYAPRPGQPVEPVVLAEDNGPIHTSKLSLAALDNRAQGLTVELDFPHFTRRSRESR